MKYIIEFEDEPSSKEDGLVFYKCLSAPWFSTSKILINSLERYEQQSAYQKGYEAGFAEGRRRTELSEQKDDEIRVGDEVIAVSSYRHGTAVVVWVDRDADKARYLYSDGNFNWGRATHTTKTGRHFPEVEKLLEAMRK